MPGWKGDGWGGVWTMCRVWRDWEGGRVTVKFSGGEDVSSAYSCEDRGLAFLGDVMGGEGRMGW